MIAGLAFALPEGMNEDLLVVLGLFLLVFAVAVFALYTLGRRRQADEIREVVVALEEMRSGRLRNRPEIGRRSAMSLVADSVQRLAQDININTTELARARERIAVLEQAVPDTAIITTDHDGNIRTVNGNACDLFGWQAGDVLSQPAAVLFDDLFWKELLPSLARKSLREAGIRMQGEMVRYDGSPFHADLTVQLLRKGDAASGPSTGFVLVVRNVEELEELSSRLEAAEEQQELLMDGIADGVAILSDGEIVHANAALAALMAVDAATLEGCPFMSLVATADLLQVREWLGGLEGGGAAAKPFRLTLRREDGEGTSSVMLKASPIRYQGKPAILAIFRDITGQSRFEEELQRNEARLDAVLEAAPEGILVLVETPEGPLVHLTNHTFLDMFGLEQRTVLGLPEGEILRLLRRRSPDGDGVAAFLASANREAVRDTLPAEAPGGRVLNLAVTPLLDRQGRFLGRMLSCSDHSDREIRSAAAEADIAAIRDTSRQLDRTNTDLRQKMAELEQYNQELLRLDEMKSRLLGNVSHELQTPLVAIRGYTEMILKGRLGSITEEQSKGLTLSLRNIDRLIAMIDGLLNLARNERLNLTVFPLRKLVEECEELIRPKLKLKNLTLSVRHEEQGIHVHGDREKLFQVFVNLLGNAVKYNMESGRIELRSRRGEEGLVAVEVRDTGIGISPDDQKQIFDRFYRADRSGTSAETEGGAGIGLSIVHNILRLHGCTIHVESEPGQGAVFSFTLPLAEDGEGEGHREDSDPPRFDQPDEPEKPDDPEPRDRPRLRIIRP